MQTSHKTVYRTTFNAPIEKVWDGLTNPLMVKQYFFGSDMVTTWETGSPIYFRGEWEGKSYEDKGIVKEFVPNKKLVYTYLSDWSNLPDSPENYLLVTYEVATVGNTSELTITQTNYDAEKAKHSEANWGSVMDGLKKLIEK